MVQPTLILDCHAIAHQSKHAYSGLTYSGVPTGVIFGFLTRLLNLAEQFGTDHIIFTFDSSDSKRRDLFPQYKSKEQEFTPEEIQEYKETKLQIQVLRTEILPYVGFNNLFLEPGYEADDLMASIVLNNKGDFILCTDDRDLYQMLDHCAIFKLKTKKMYYKEDLKKEWNCTPNEWRRMKAYAGCKGDGVPGIPGIGDKSAIKYVQGSLKGKKFQDITFTPNKDIALNRRLTSLPFRGMEPVYIGDPLPLKFWNCTAICETYGLTTLVKGKKLVTWKMLSHEKGVYE